MSQGLATGVDAYAEQMVSPLNLEGTLVIMFPEWTISWVNSSLGGNYSMKILNNLSVLWQYVMG